MSCWVAAVAEEGTLLHCGAGHLCGWRIASLQRSHTPAHTPLTELLPLPPCLCRTLPGAPTPLQLMQPTQQ